MTTKKKPKRKKATKRTARTTGGRRRTSDRIVKFAAKWMNEIRQIRRDNGAASRDWTVEVPIGELGALCASCLVQDEVKGPRK
jgi:hypothetical protein